MYMVFIHGHGLRKRILSSLNSGWAEEILVWLFINPPMQQIFIGSVLCVWALNNQAGDTLITK